MAKERSPAYQHYPKDILSDLNYQAMTWAERGMYRHLVDICWLEGSIPDDEKLLARILGLPEDDFKGSWVLVSRCFTKSAISEQLIHPELERQRQIQAEWREKSAKGGKRSAHKRKVKKEHAAQQGGSDLLASKPQANGNQRSTLLSSVSLIPSAVPGSPSAVSAPQSAPAEKDSAAQQASPQGDGTPPSGTERKKADEAYELFCSEFEKHRGIPYQRGKKGDFVQLSALRKQLNIEGKATPAEWTTARENYFDSPLNKYTLADLCGRFEIFNVSALDRFNKPVNAEGFLPKRHDSFGGPDFNPENCVE